jgi:hypothetical protein
MPNETNFASSTNASEKFLFECRLGVTRGFALRQPVSLETGWLPAVLPRDSAAGTQNRVIDRRSLLVNIDYGKRFGCVCGMKADRV